MLIEFSISNFMSFKDEMVFSMERSNIDKETLKDNYFTHNKIDLLKSAVILGPNASGKTNLIQALEYIRFLVLESRKFERDVSIKYFPFKLNKEYRVNCPIGLKVKFIHNENIFTYEIKIKNIGSDESQYHFVIDGEILTRNNKIIFNRTSENKFPDSTNKYMSKKLKSSSELLLRNSLLLSSYGSNDLPELKDAYEWFEKVLRIYSGNKINKRDTIHYFLNDDKFKSYLMNSLKNADLGNISNFDIIEENIQMKFPADISQSLKERIIFDNKYQFKTYHTDDDNKSIEFDFKMEESNGTQKYILLIGIIYDMIKNNKVILFDELENSLHPDILKNIFYMLHRSDARAQMIVSTHSYSLLQYVNDIDEEVFRRDQIWFTRKRKDMSTQLYSLINIGGIRKDLRIFKAYFDGRLEALPDIKLM